MGRGSVRHQPRASSPTSWRSAAAALLLLAAFALADASQLDEDLTFDEEAVGVARIRREAEVAPVAPPYQEVPSAKATLTKRQSGWGFWGSSSDDEDDDVGSAIEGSGVEKVIYRVKFQVNLTWRVEYSNKQGTYFRDLATEIRNAFEIILRPVSGDKTLFVSNMKRTPTNYVEVTMDINYEGFGDQSGALERRIREALGTSRLGSIPVNTQFFRFEDHGSAVTSPTACPPGKWRCSSGRCVGRCDGRDDCLDKSDEQDCITSSSSSITGSKADEGCRGDDQFRCAGPDDVYVCEVQRCDGHADCPEGDDEEGCDCAPGNFVCDGVRCVPNEKKCDGTRDCVDNSDEENCARPTCRSDDQGPRTCDDGTTYACFCDGVRECPRGEDEAGCASSDCPSTMFSCDQGSVCIDLSKTCDNRADCYDGTDELGCATVVPCRSDEFTCKDGSCVASFRRCDYIQDCPDGEDESFCRKYCRASPKPVPFLCSSQRFRYAVGETVRKKM